MSRSRDVSPIVKTYIKLSKTKTGKSVIHARMYSPECDLDISGSGRDLSSALSKIVKKTKPSKK